MGFFRTPLAILLITSLASSSIGAAPTPLGVITSASLDLISWTESISPPETQFHHAEFNPPLTYSLLRFLAAATSGDTVNVNRRNLLKGIAAGLVAALWSGAASAQTLPENELVQKIKTMLRDSFYVELRMSRTDSTNQTEMNRLAVLLSKHLQDLQDAIYGPKKQLANGRESLDPAFSAQRADAGRALVNLYDQDLDWYVHRDSLRLYATLVLADPGASANLSEEVKEKIIADTVTTGLTDSVIILAEHDEGLRPLVLRFALLEKTRAQIRHDARIENLLESVITRLGTPQALFKEITNNELNTQEKNDFIDRLLRHPGFATWKIDLTAASQLSSLAVTAPELKRISEIGEKGTFESPEMRAFYLRRLDENITLRKVDIDPPTPASELESVDNANANQLLELLATGSTQFDRQHILKQLETIDGRDQAFLEHPELIALVASAQETDEDGFIGVRIARELKGPGFEGILMDTYLALNLKIEDIMLVSNLLNIPSEYSGRSAALRAASVYNGEIRADENALQILLQDLSYGDAGRTPMAAQLASRIIIEEKRRSAWLEGLLGQAVAARLVGDTLHRTAIAQVLDALAAKPDIQKRLADLLSRTAQADLIEEIKSYLPVSAFKPNVQPGHSSTLALAA